MDFSLTLKLDAFKVKSFWFDRQIQKSRNLLNKEEYKSFRNLIVQSSFYWFLPCNQMIQVFYCAIRWFLYIVTHSLSRNFHSWSVSRTMKHLEIQTCTVLYCNVVYCTVAGVQNSGIEVDYCHKVSSSRCYFKRISKSFYH